MKTHAVVTLPKPKRQHRLVATAGISAGRFSWLSCPAAGLAEKASLGHAIGPAPLGYRQEKSPSGRGARILPNEKTMPVLTELLRDYASGRYSFRTLALELNGKGHRTSSGKPFTESSISTVLNNRFYGGKAVYHRDQPDEVVRVELYRERGLTVLLAA